MAKDTVEITNLSNGLVSVAGLGIAPQRTGTLPAHVYRVWLSHGDHNKDIARTKLRAVYETPWGSRTVVSPATNGDTLPQGTGETGSDGNGDSGASGAEGESDADAPLTPEGRAKRIRDAILELDPDNQNEFTLLGIPRVPAIKDTSGLTDVTAAERDAVWAAILAEREAESG